MEEQHEIFTKPLPQILDEMKARIEEAKQEARQEAEKKDRKRLNTR